MVKLFQAGDTNSQISLIQQKPGSLFGILEASMVHCFLLNWTQDDHESRVESTESLTILVGDGMIRRYWEFGDTRWPKCYQL